MIYYLNWDEEREEHGPATELFHKISVKSVLDEDEKPGNQYTSDEFEDLYREISDVDLEDPEQAFREWNRGSGQGSQDFYEHQIRSLSVGDVVEIDGVYYRCEAIGWEEIEVEDQ